MSDPSLMKVIYRSLKKKKEISWHKVHSFKESLAYAFVKPRKYRSFHVVSCQKNAGEATLKCLESVYNQQYKRSLVKHVYIDDASTDATNELIVKWLSDHPGHNVEYIRNETNMGGCANNLKGFRLAPSGSIILEVNGDDRLPDPGVITYLNKVYEDPDVWMTYNSFKATNGFYLACKPITEDTTLSNNYRDKMELGRHLHSFRQELFSHLDEEALIDPQTGEYFISGDDQAFYYSLQELAGIHARHLYRTTYIYNFNGFGTDYGNTSDQEDRVRRILQKRPYKPLELLRHIDSHR